MTQGSVATEMKAMAVKVPYADKLGLFVEVKADLRFPDYLYGCYECGICVAVCPSARFYDFNPRRIAQAVAREDVELVYEQMNGEGWECSQCFSCLRCPRGNNPGGVVTILREVAVRHGLPTRKAAGDASPGLDSDIQVLEADQGQYMGFIRMVAHKPEK